MPLDEYLGKRDFSITPEPKGDEAAGDERIFVVQKHAARRLHYDLRLEEGGILLSWAVPKGPSMDPSVKRLAVRTEDHPLDYASFEGNIPKGQYGAGTVMIWDSGIFINRSKKDGKPISVQDAIKKGHITFYLEGHRLLGQFHLIKTRGEKDWLLFKDSGEHAYTDHDVLDEGDTSVASGRDMGSISSAHDTHDELRKLLKRSGMPTRVNPMLATLAKEVGEGEWLIERKYDGERCIAYKRKGRVSLRSRNDKSLDNSYPEIIEALEGSHVGSFVIDGEIVAFDGEKTEFSLLQERMHVDDPKKALNSGIDVFYYIFDVIHIWGYDVTSLPLLKRKRMLRSFFAFKDPIRYSIHERGNVREIFNKACQLGWEGVMIKRPDSRYLQRRSTDWLKLKCTNSQEFVVGGFTEPKGERGGLGSLMLGYHKGKKLHYAGRVGTGFTERELERLSGVLSGMETGVSPFSDLGGQIDGVHWTMPSMIVEVEFSEWTSNGRLRHPVYKGTRTDKDQKDVRREVPGNPGGHRVKLSNPKKKLFRGVDKEMVYDYYTDVSEKMLKHIRDRPLTVQRFPDGIQKEGFYQKERQEYFPEWIGSARIEADDGSSTTYPVCNDLPSLQYMVNLASITFHMTTSRASSPDNPDRLVIDLDPPEDNFGGLIPSAYVIRDFIEDLGLSAHPMTTGSKGLHIVSPIEPLNDYAGIKKFVDAVAKTITIENKGLFTTELRKDRRKGKIFVDVLRNRKSQTSVAPYSLRPNEGAPIACPVRWPMLEEEGFSSQTINIANYTDYVNKGHWNDYFKSSISLDGPRAKLMDRIRDLKDSM